jgi:hypothetical protein
MDELEDLVQQLKLNKQHMLILIEMVSLVDTDHLLMAVKQNIV